MRHGNFRKSLRKCGQVAGWLATVLSLVALDIRLMWDATGACLAFFAFLPFLVAIGYAVYWAASAVRTEQKP